MGRWRSLEIKFMSSLIMIRNKIPRRIKTTFFLCFAVGLITHMFMLTNKLPNHDDIDQTFNTLDFMISSGRWFSPVPAAISSTFSMPWVNGLLCIVYISAASCFVVSLLKINQTVYCALIGTVMIAFPAISATLLFMQCADAYCFALMLACFAAFLAGTYRPLGYIYAVVPLTLSLGIYQAYFGVTSGLMIMVLMIEVLKNETPFKRLLLKGVQFAVTLGASLVMYLAMVKITTMNRGLTSYQGINRMGRISLSELPGSVVKAYKSIFEYFLSNKGWAHYPFMPAVFWVSFLSCASLLVMWCIKKNIHKEPIKMILLISLIALFPLGCNIIYVITPSRTIIHDLMIYGMVLVPVFLVTVADQFTIHNSGFTIKKRIQIAQNISCWIITLAIALSGFNYFIRSNQVYFKQFFTYEKSYAQSVSLINRIRQVDGYTSETEIVFVGWLNYSNGTPELETLIDTTMTEIYGNHYYPDFLKRYLNFTQPVEWMQSGVIEDSEISAIVEGMPEYPDDGSIALIEDKIYVKFNYNPERE